MATRVKRTALFAEFPRINAAFDLNTVQISRVLSTANRHFTRKPADARHLSDCKRGNTRLTNCQHHSLQKGENNNCSQSEAVMSVATWLVSKHSVHIF